MVATRWRVSYDRVPHERRQRTRGGPVDIRDVHIREWSGSELSARVNDAMAIYVLAMNYPGYAGSQRSVTTRRHTTNRGFTCRVALRTDGTLVGFGYGYTTTAGQWWHDLVRKALSPSVAADWMADAFELSEIHVLPTYQGQGVGHRILVSLAAGVPTGRCCSRLRTPTPGPSGCTEPWASRTWPATICSLGTHDRSPCSAPASP